MKKRVIAIVVMVVLVMSMVACGSTQAQPVQESTPVPKTEATTEPAEETKVETPAVAEEPKAEESEVKEEPAAEASTEETDTNNPNVIDGVDCTAYVQGNIAPVDFVNTVKCDTLRVFVFSGESGERTIEAVLADGETFTMSEDHEPYIFVYYTPKKVSSVKRAGEEGYYPDFMDIHGVVWDYVIVTDSTKFESGEDIPVGANVVYEDGTEDSIMISLTKNY